VVHDVTRGKDLVFHQVREDGTCNVVQAAAEHRVDKLVAASSASVYGLAEQLRSFRAGSGLDYVMLHYFNAYGPRMGTHGLYGEMLVRWMERIEDGLPPQVFGDGGQTIDLAFTTDIARANVLAAKSAVTEGVYHVASGHQTSLLQVAETLLRVMGADLAVELGPEPAATGAVRPRADTSAAACDLGFVAQVGLEEGLRRLVEWWQPHLVGALRSAGG
jgi:UDP-glucose 4-epimerase